MAARLFAKRKVISYLPNLRTAVKNVRCFSTTIDHEFEIRPKDPDADSQTVWPDASLGPFGHQDRRFPLPGQTGPSPDLVQEEEGVGHSYNPICLLGYQNYKVVLSVMAAPSDQEAEEGEEEEGPPKLNPNQEDLILCAAQECPDMLKKDFISLFTSHNVMEGDLTIITISQKTIDDMTGWNAEDEEEREELIHVFIRIADHICNTLRNENFWADFIDPRSGRPYFGAHTNHRLFEWEERFQELGLEIEDHGLCKVISHHIWGTQTFVGCIVTNAPISYSLFRDVRK